MTRRLNIVSVTVPVLLGALVWLPVWGQKAAVDPLAAAGESQAAAPSRETPSRETPSRETPSAPARAPQAIQVDLTAPPAAPAATSTPPAAVPAAAPAAGVVAVTVSDQGVERVGYTAAAGDTLSDVAAGLHGSDSRSTRQSVIDANPSLQDNPDRVLTGKTYFLAAAAVPAEVAAAPTEAAVSADAAAVPAVEAPVSQGRPAEAAGPDAGRVLSYIAAPGDTVSVLAAGLLGGDTVANRAAIIGQNPSLRRNPDLVVAGQSYAIPTTDGLSAAPAKAAAAAAPGASATASQTGGGAGRELRYTARPGDTVSSLATALLGSDTAAHRDAIVHSNASLESDPDRVTAGQTYWIPAPDAAAP